MEKWFLYLQIFGAGGLVFGVIGAGAMFLILRNNPQIVKELEESLAKAKAEAAKYREQYEALVAKIKLKVEDK